MKYFILRRILLCIPIFLATLTVVFLLVRVVPGDPTFIILDEYASPESIRVLRSRLGLDLPLHQQYFNYISNFIRGDFGRSLRDDSLIIERLLRVLPYTLDLTATAILISIIIGIPIGIMCAVYRNRFIDHFFRIVSLTGLSMPTFLLGALFLMVFSVVYFRWFPVIGGGDLGSLGSRIHHLFLPALSLGLVEASFITRMTRICMLEVLNEDYIRTARAKGLMERVVIFSHGLRSALIPIITLIGLNISRLLGGSILIETVFTRPGIGKVLVDAVQTRDYPILQTGIALFAGTVVLVNLLVDLTYAFVDPRIKYQ